MAEISSTMKKHSEELVFIESEDGLSQTGAAIRPVDSPSRPVAVVWIHGNTGKFCDYPYITIGRAMAEQGYLFITGNTRGHDISATLWKMPEDKSVAGGSTWELYEESPYDIGAWVNYAAGLGVQKAILVGHSLGAAKVIYYQALRQDSRVGGIVAASPDLRGHWSAQLVSEAQRLVTAGQGTELLPPLMGAFWYRLSARNIVSRSTVLSQTYLSETGVPHIAEIGSPLLAFFGGHDVGGVNELDIIRKSAVKASRIDTHLIENADHVYTGYESQAANLIATWIEALQ
jgi:pimeloyl-ACP methyl ester carboxylesterase